MILKSKEYNFLEFAICGFSGSGKTTLIQKLIKELSLNYNLFYAKHDTHHFEMDKENKDTFKSMQAGANGISIFDKNHWATIQNHDFLIPEKKLIAINYDFALIEGHKYTNLSKLLFLDKNEDALNEYKNGKIKNVSGFIYENESQIFKDELPFFHRDDVPNIKKFILSHFTETIQKLPLNALVLVGGKSTRMGEDKAKIKYYNDYQSQHLAKLLGKYCQNVFFSCRPNQENEKHLEGFPKIKDTFLEIGPTGGILSYFKQYPESKLLVVACDMPFIDNDSIEELIHSHNPYKVATAFKNPEKNWPEPLFAIYNPKSYSRLLQLLACGYDCPMKMLFNSNINLIDSKKLNTTLNANTLAEKEIVSNLLRGEF